MTKQYKMWPITKRMKIKAWLATICYAIAFILIMAKVII